MEKCSLSCIWKAAFPLPITLVKKIKNRKIKAFSKILQGRQRLVSVLHKLLGYHEEFKVTEEMQYWQKGNRDKKGTIKIGIA